MTRFFTVTHKWLGLLVGAQLILWMLSGLMMALFDHHTVQGGIYRAEPLPAQTLADGVMSPQALAAQTGMQDLLGIESGWLLERPVYRVLRRGDPVATLHDAFDGRPIQIDQAAALAIARRDYTGPGRATEAHRVQAPMREIRRHQGAAWRVDFDDELASSIYVSAHDGRILERRNDTWRWFDLFWMLHIMDYANRENFNNPLVIMAAAGGLWLALSGIWLFFASFRLSEFLPRALRPWAPPLRLFGREGSQLAEVRPRHGDDVYAALGHARLNLPSNCGGGGSCGLCVVRVRSSTPPAPSAADRALIDPARLRQGHRLACRLPATRAAAIDVPDEVLWAPQAAEVLETRAVTPWMREIRFRPLRSGRIDCIPGSYVQVHVPAYRMPAERLQAPDGVALPAQLQSKAPVHRAYSLSTPAGGEGGMTLLVRFNPGGAARRGASFGKGSAYLLSLRPGDRFDFSGPYGDFAIRDGKRDLVFLGGGAGMAPLRAMLHALLADAQESRPIEFWYGARSERDIPYREELDALSRAHPRFRWYPVLSEPLPDDDPTLARGLVHAVFADALRERESAAEACDYYLCGPPPMLAASRRLLRGSGVPDGQVAFDDFKI